MNKLENLSDKLLEIGHKTIGIFVKLIDEGKISVNSTREILGLDKLVQ